jgi:hypothetical protein
MKGKGYQQGHGQAGADTGQCAANHANKAGQQKDKKVFRAEGYSKTLRPRKI